MILTDTSVSIGDQLEILGAQAFMPTFQVKALSIEARLRTFALVDVSTVSACSILLITVMAMTPKHSKDVFAGAKHAEVVKHLTFVDIFKIGKF